MRRRNFRLNLLAVVGLFALGACGGGGGGGGGGGSEPAPTLTLSASPTSVMAGESTTLTWSSTNADSCTASGGWSGTKETSGSESSGALTGDVTFRLSCTGAGGTVERSVAVTVTPVSAPTVSLAASPDVVNAGGAATLNWSSENATSCTASGGWSGAKNTSGSEATGALNQNTTFTLSCSGPGGTTSQSITVLLSNAPAPAPIVTLSANPAAIVAGETTTIVWSSTNASSCIASGGWSGARGPAGSEQFGSLVEDATFSLSCTGPGGADDASVTVAVSQPAPANVVVSGKITFDRPSFRAAGTGLDMDDPVQSPARHVAVEAVAPGGNVLVTGVTDSNGDYALTVPSGTAMFIRARAQMVRGGAGPSWNFEVRNNTNGDSLYALRGEEFNSGTANSIRNLHASTGWTGAGYGAQRPAAPFAILDAAYRAKELILAADPNATFPPLDFFWSRSNRPTVGPFCPADGDIGTTSYVVYGAPPLDVDDCGLAGVEGVYVLGDFDSGDTDEFDAHVIAHEFGHYFEHRFSRSDSIGGEHAIGEKLDLRLAFGEGWGNAFAAMTVGDPVYRDSHNGVSQDFGMDLESGVDDPAKGWYSEGSVGRILWDIFDPANEPGVDDLSEGFAPIYEIMTGPQVDTPAYTSIFTLIDALRDRFAGAQSAITSLLAAEDISGTGEFGAGESNHGGVSGAVPIYTQVQTPQPPIAFCTNNTGAMTLNKLGNRKFFRLDIPSGGASVVIQVNGDASNGQTPAQDPDMVLSRGASFIYFSTDVPGQETTRVLPLEAGTFLIEVYDWAHRGASEPRCMTLSVQSGG